jgi:hypothetical protein
MSRPLLGSESIAVLPLDTAQEVGNDPELAEVLKKMES